MTLNVQVMVVFTRVVVLTHDQCLGAFQDCNASISVRLTFITLTKRIKMQDCNASISMHLTFITLTKIIKRFLFV